MKNALLLGVCAVALLVSSPSFAATVRKDLDQAIEKGDLTTVKPYLTKNPKQIDSVLRTLLSYAQAHMVSDPIAASNATTLAGSYAAKITPSGVSMVCTSVRDVVKALPEESRTHNPGLYQSVLNASRAFTKAPAVVSAGRPNLCADAWTQTFETADAASLAQSPNPASPPLPVRYLDTPHKAGETLASAPGKTAPTAAAAQAKPAAAASLAASSLIVSPSFEVISKSIARGDFAQVRPYLTTNPSQVDAVVKALLAYAQDKVATDVDEAGRSMGLAGSFANSITPPSVPAVCTSVRAIVEGFPASSKSKNASAYSSVIGASEAFAKAPVVVAAGKPNMCDGPWLKDAGGAEDAELAMSPGFAAPSIRTRLPEVPHPPGDVPASNPDNPSSPQ